MVLRWLLLCVLTARTAALSLGSAEQQVLKFLRADPPVLQPIKFHQRLLICNAYANSQPMTVNKNDQDMLSGEGVKYRDCQYLDAQVQPKDRLNFKVKDQEIGGSFVVGNLPSGDAVLLLVLEKRPGTSLVNFQSFAFPTGGNGEGKEAQVAVIDAVKAKDSAPHLRMEDHVNEKNGAAATRRVEQLTFNRVYAVEEGLYDASVEAAMSNGAANSTDQVASAMDSMMHTIQLVKNENYVILRAGDEEFGDTPGLVVFPQTGVKSAGARSVAASPLLATLGLLVLGAFLQP